MATGSLVNPVTETQAQAGVSKNQITVDVNENLNQHSAIFFFFSFFCFRTKCRDVSFVPGLLGESLWLQFCPLAVRSYHDSPI